MGAPCEAAVLDRGPRARSREVAGAEDGPGAVLLHSHDGGERRLPSSPAALRRADQHAPLRAQVTVESAAKLVRMDVLTENDVFVDVEWAGQRFRTATVSAKKPVFNEKVFFWVNRRVPAAAAARCASRGLSCGRAQRTLPCAAQTGPDVVCGHRRRLRSGVALSRLHPHADRGFACAQDIKSNEKIGQGFFSLRTEDFDDGRA